MSQVSVTALRNPRAIWEEAKKTGSLWVLNTSDAGGTRRRGEVMLSVMDENSKEIVVLLPSTWMPLDLSSYTDTAHFEKSTNFRAYINNELITVITDESAQQLLKDPAAKPEAVRVKALMANNRNALGVPLAGGEGSETIKVNTGLTQPHAITKADEAAVSKEDMASGNTPAVQQLLGKLNKITHDRFGEVAPELINLLGNSTMDEVKALAAGINDHTSLAFQYIDIALDSMGRGEPVDVAAMSAMSPPPPEGQEVTISVA